MVSAAPVALSPADTQRNVSAPAPPVNRLATWLAISVSLPTPATAFSINERVSPLKSSALATLPRA